MLPIEWKPINYGSVHVEPWEEYALRMMVPEDRVEQEFFRQVVYDHLDHFNYHYPDMKLSDYTISIVTLTARQVQDQVQYFCHEPVVEMWGDQFDEFLKEDPDYFVFRRMRDEGTPPFPPVLIDSSQLIDGDWIYGRPFHLIEGTHRTSYLLRMAELGMIRWDSVHEFVLLTPR